jgi:hypothetical protein
MAGRVLTEHQNDAFAADIERNGLAFSRLKPVRGLAQRR